MNLFKLIGVLLLVGGVFALVYGGFTYPTDSHDAKIGPFELSVSDHETITVPVWAGAGAIALGGFLLFFGSRKRLP